MNADDHEEAPRPWFHRPEWIGTLLTVTIVTAGLVWSQSQSAARTDQNTREIMEIKGQLVAMPERLARIEQKVDDLKNIETQRRGERD